MGDTIDDAAATLASGQVDRILQRNKRVSLEQVRTFVRHLRTMGRPVYLFAEELAAMTHNFKVTDILNVHVNEIDPIEFAKAYPWVVYTLNRQGAPSFRSAPFVPGVDGGSTFGIGADVGDASNTGDTADAPVALDYDGEMALKERQRDLYGIGMHLEDVVGEYVALVQPFYQASRQLLVGASIGAGAGDGGSARRIGMPPVRSGSDGLSVYDTLLLKPEVMGLVRQALADINNWHRAARTSFQFTFGDMLGNATVRSMFARFASIRRAHAYEVGGNTYSGVNQYGMPFSRSSGKTRYQLAEQLQTIRAAQRYFLSLRKRANGQVDIGTLAPEDRRLREMEQRALASGSRLSGNILLDAGGEQFTSVLGTF